MRQIVCISCEPWKVSPERTQQLVTRLKDVEILFFEPYAGGRRREPGRKVRANITVYSLPIQRDKKPKTQFGSRLNEKRIKEFLLKTLQKHRFRDPVLWIDSPEFYSMVNTIPHSGLVYDCAKEWDDFPIEWESELALQADVAFAASPELAERLSPCCDNVAVIPNGVNYPMFTRDDWEVPRRLRGKDHPILCRVGAVRETTELEPLLYAAAARPEWTFVLVGDVDEKVYEKLERSYNIVLTGHVPMVDVPDYLGSSQVSFDLLSRMTRGSDLLPIRFYEYLAIGNPIVLMLETDQVEPLPDVVYTASTPAEFLRSCEKAIKESSDRVRERRRAHAEAAQWSERANEIQRILENIMLL